LRSQLNVQQADCSAICNRPDACKFQHRNAITIRLQVSSILQTTFRIAEKFSPNAEGDYVGKILGTDLRSRYYRASRVTNLHGTPGHEPHERLPCDPARLLTTRATLVLPDRSIESSQMLVPAPDHYTSVGKHVWTRCAQRSRHPGSGNIRRHCSAFAAYSITVVEAKINVIRERQTHRPQ
jgi:hypothetical protein